MKHLLYETGDADAPDVIKDRNGEVVLGLCRICDKGEIELSELCHAGAPRDWIAQRFLYETGVFDNPAQIKANTGHQLVVAAYRAADKILPLLRSDKI